MANEQTPGQATPPPTFADKPAAAVTPAAPAATEKPAVVTPVDAPAATPQTETKPPEQGAKPVVPEKYELKLSENSILDQASISRIEDYARKAGLSQEDAQSVLKAQEEDVSAFIEDRKAAWKEQSLKDPEIGGANLKENIALASQVLEKYASPALKSEFNKSGYGNHPELVRMFVKIGKQMADDKAVIPRTQSGPTKSVQDVLYDKTK